MKIISCVFSLLILSVFVHCSSWPCHSFCSEKELLVYWLFAFGVYINKMPFTTTVDISPTKCYSFKWITGIMFSIRVSSPVKFNLQKINFLIAPSGREHVKYETVWETYIYEKWKMKNVLAGWFGQILFDVYENKRNEITSSLWHQSYKLMCV